MNLGELVKELKASGKDVPDAFTSRVVLDAVERVTVVLDKLPLTPEERKVVGLMVAMHAVMDAP
jgi:hypothetical protein